MLVIGSTRTNQALFTVRSFGGGQLNLPPEKARALLRLLSELNDPSVFVQIDGAEPVPANCVFGGAMKTEYERTVRLREAAGGSASNEFSSRALENNNGK